MVLALRPFLFLDVDGPLIPFGSGQPYPTFESANGIPDAAGANPLLARIKPDHGRRLAALGCELVWATSWMHDANDDVAPRLGLSPLPVVEWVSDDDDLGGLHWKTRELVDWSGGRSFIWVDDEITDHDRAWVAEHHHGSALLHRVNPHTGLADADYAAIREWLNKIHSAMR